jgi:endonuclease/exonuclease/phosphatase family metal-dependent hydrolase
LAWGISVGVATAWIGLMASSWRAPESAPPPLKSNPTAIRVISWNVLYGRRNGPFWDQRDWSTRQSALGEVIRAADPDILCVQEALLGQLEFLQQTLGDHERLGVGRDDGAGGGEHCAILFDTRRFRELASGTFWLEDPRDQPRKTWRLSGPKRICSWARLLDRRNGRVLRVYNIHSYLSESARMRASQIVLEHIRAGELSDAIVLAGDFNTGPRASSRRVFDSAGLLAAQTPADAARATFHFYGIRLASLDAILVNDDFRAISTAILDQKPGNTFPSDHFGVMADLLWND